MVKALLFSFNDLPRLPQRARAALFDKVSTDVVVMALRGTDAEFREPVLSAMASRSRRLVEGELASPGAASAADTSKARKQIVDLVLKMAQKGEVELPQGDAPATA
jgi:flagellar motor switch protein FliG